MASLYQRKGSANYWIKIHRPGRRNKPDRIPTGTSDPKRAKEIMDGIVGDAARGLPIHPKAHTIEFWQLAEMVMEDYENEGYASLKHAKGRFENHIVPYFGPMIAAAMTEDDIRKYKTKRRLAGASAATIKRELELVKRAFTLGNRSYRIPGPYIQMPELSNARRGFFEEADFRNVMAAIKEAYRPFLLFAYITGWRVGEIRDLRRRHIDFAGKVIRLDPGTTKNGDARVFPMIAGLETMLREQLAKPGFGDAHVFTYELRGKRRPIGDFGKAFNTACYEAGLPCETEPWSYTDRWGNRHTGVRVLDASNIPHDFRRTAVRNLTRMGIPEKVAMDMCGHRTREVFDRYRIVSQSDLDIAAERMNAAYAGLPTAVNAGTVAGTVEGKPKNKIFRIKG
jgi:integrase